MFETHEEVVRASFDGGGRRCLAFGAESVRGFVGVHADAVGDAHEWNLGE